MGLANEVSVSGKEALERRIATIVGDMSIAEKVGQMSQVSVGDGSANDDLFAALRAGRVGSVLNVVDVTLVNELQRVAVEETRLGIPLLVGRDVIHGFKTVMPIPLGQAATWNPDVVRRGARVAAREASASGVNWTLAPMIDVSRDPRWGRIAESLGEDPFLAGALGVAMVQGFQGDDPSMKGHIAACGKHFAGYGAVESGRDYATTNVPENEMRSVYLPPFKAVIDAGVMTLMTSFSDIDGIPATANEHLLRSILRGEWRFDGVVVSDWDSIPQLSVHGITASDEDAAREALQAGVDMEMNSATFLQNVERLVACGRLDERIVDAATRNILRAKFRLGLFDNAYTDVPAAAAFGAPDALETAKQAALESIVMLKNHAVLPLPIDGASSIALIGPLADAPKEQLGTWVFDGDASLSVTPLAAIRASVGDRARVDHVPALTTTRSRDTSKFDDAVNAASRADIVVLFLGEEAILSGEAHSRADISLPGAQSELVQRVRAAGKPTVAVIMTGRPLTLTDIVDSVDAILVAWHPGTMGGAAIADLLFGVASPSGKLPATFPRMVGQIPIYYGQKNTGKPPSADSMMLIDDFQAGAEQSWEGLSAYHLDAGHRPLFAFGEGLSYTEFLYENIRTDTATLRLGDAMTICADVTNIGDRSAVEVAQLYVRDLVGSVTRPVRELKGFQRLRLRPGERNTVCFRLHTDDLAFFGRNKRWLTEPGKFDAWIGGSSDAELTTTFSVCAE